MGGKLCDKAAVCSIAGFDYALCMINQYSVLLRVCERDVFSRLEPYD